MFRRTAWAECGYFGRYSTIACLFIALPALTAVADDAPASDGNAELASLLASARKYEIRIKQTDAVLNFRR